MKKRNIVIVTGLVILSALPFTLNILINMFFDDLDTANYEKRKARAEQRRQIESMFPDLDTTDPLRAKTVEVEEKGKAQ